MLTSADRNGMDPSRGQGGVRVCKPLVRFMEKIEGSRNRDSGVFAQK